MKGIYRALVPIIPINTAEPSKNKFFRMIFIGLIFALYLSQRGGEKVITLINGTE